MQDDSGRRPDGAVAALERDPASRKRFLKMAGGSAMAGALASVLSSCGSGSEAGGAASGGSRQSSAKGDLDVVNLALTLEYLEADFYTRVLEAGIFSGGDADLIETIRDNEREHVAALRTMADKLGGPVAPRPTANFPLRNRSSVLVLAAELENTGAAAYLGQVDRIVSQEVLVAALSIHTVEGRHAAVLSRMAGGSFSPEGFLASPITKTEALRRVQPFIVG